MKKMRFLCLSTAVFMAISGICLKVLGTDIATTQGCHGVDAAMTLSMEEQLTETAKAIVLYERNSGTMLYTWNPDGRIYPTSMVKLMTTLVALENADLEEEVTVTRKVLDQVPIGTVSAELKVGEKITMRDLLYCVMVQSANDASVVVANHIAGSAEAFVELMNAKAAELGCRDTQYSNVHGLHDEQTYTTARDICRITEAGLQNETFRTMFRTVKYTVAPTNKSPEGKNITTTNHMMNERNLRYYDPLVTGGKTGATDEGGRCLTMTAEKDGMELLCVLMGATPTVAEDGTLSAFGSFEESKVLMDYAFDNFAYRQVFFSGQSLAQYPVANGANDVVTQTNSTISTIVPRELDESQLKWVYQPAGNGFTAPVSKGQKLGAVEVWYGNKCLAQTDMVAMNAVEVKRAPVVPSRPAGGSDGSWMVVVWVLLGAAVLFFGGVFAIRTVRIMQFRQRQKRRRSRRR